MLLYRVSTAFDDLSSNGLTATSFLFLEIDMSEVKFTKGYWTVQFGDMVFASDGVNNDQVAAVFNEDNKDAHLIAAAPEMYDMLQELLYGGSLHRMDAKAISDLLAKARGE